MVRWDRSIVDNVYNSSNKGKHTVYLSQDDSVWCKFGVDNQYLFLHFWLNVGEGIDSSLLKLYYKCVCCTVEVPQNVNGETVPYYFLTLLPIVVYWVWRVNFKLDLLCYLLDLLKVNWWILRHLFHFI